MDKLPHLEQGQCPCQLSVNVCMLFVTDCIIAKCQEQFTNEYTIGADVISNYESVTANHYEQFITEYIQVIIADMVCDWMYHCKALRAAAYGLKRQKIDAYAVF